MVQHACPHGSLDTSNYATPLPIIGIYIVVASLLCFVGISIDTFRGFRQRKLWFPCKYYSLNAATLTVLAVATKLPVDLNSPMPSRQDQLTKLTGSIMICISIGFFMPSLGNMTRAELLSNLIAISIMAITEVVNICIQIGTGVIFAFLVEHVIILAFILALVVISWFSSLSLALVFRELFTAAYVMNPSSLPRTFEKASDGLKEVWKVAYVVDPQYVLGRSPNCITVSILCGISVMVLLQAILRSFVFDNSSFCHGVSDYRFSIGGVVAAQTSALILAGVATTTRWFVLAYHVSPERFGSWTVLFKVENNYLKWLIGLKNQVLLSFNNGFLQRILGGLTKIMFSLLIISQKGIVMMGKFVCIPSMWCGFLLKKFLGYLGCNMENSNENPSSEKAINSISSILGEMDLVPWIVSNSMRDWTKWEDKCKSSVPIHLIKLLSERPPAAGTGGQDSSTSVELVTVVRLFMFLFPSNEESTQLLVNAVNEGPEIINFMEQNSTDIKVFIFKRKDKFLFMDE